MGTVEVILEGQTGESWRPAVRRLVEELLKNSAQSDAGVVLLFTGDRAIRALNRRYRGKDQVTDVLAFPSDGELEPGRRHLGEIAISLPRATRQARRARWPLRSELALLVTHGFLHLLGYDHETDDGTMRRMEEELLQRVARVRLTRRAQPWGGPSVVLPSGRRGGARRSK